MAFPKTSRYIISSHFVFVKKKFALFSLSTFCTTVAVQTCPSIYFFNNKIWTEYRDFPHILSNSSEKAAKKLFFVQLLQKLLNYDSAPISVSLLFTPTF